MVSVRRDSHSTEPVTTALDLTGEAWGITANSKTARNRITCNSTSRNFAYTRAYTPYIDMRIICLQFRSDIDV